MTISAGDVEQIFQKNEAFSEKFKYLHLGNFIP